MKVGDYINASRHELWSSAIASMGSVRAMQVGGYTNPITSACPSNSENDVWRSVIELLSVAMESANEETPDHRTMHIEIGVPDNIEAFTTVLEMVNKKTVTVQAFTKLIGDPLFLPNVAEKSQKREVANLGERAGKTDEGKPQTLGPGGAARMTMDNLKE
jgi:hypothetical protein